MNATDTSQRSPAVAKSKSQQAYDLVHDRIIDGTYPAGARLVLGRIGDEIGTSVVPVREAIRRLEAEGLVAFTRNKGARVSELNEQEYLDTMETMSIVEGAAVALAAPHMSISRLNEARQVNDQLRGLLDDLDPVEFTRLNEKFHRLLSDGCPNQHLCTLVDTGWKALSRLRLSTFGYVPERAAASVEEHETILSLISDAAERDAIERAVRAHRLATPQAFKHRTLDPKTQSSVHV